ARQSLPARGCFIVLASATGEVAAFWELYGSHLDVHSRVDALGVATRARTLSIALHCRSLFSSRTRHTCVVWHRQPCLCFFHLCEVPIRTGLDDFTINKLSVNYSKLRVPLC